MQRNFDVFGPADRGIERFEEKRQSDAEEQAEQEADSELDGRGGPEGRVGNRGHIDHFDVAGLDFFGHLGVLIVLAEKIALRAKSIHPPAQPHFLFGHGRQELDGLPAVRTQGAERTHSSFDRREVAVYRLNQLALRRLDEAPQLQDVGIGGCGRPRPGGHGIEAELIVIELVE